jgi:hypothetical protein
MFVEIAYGRDVGFEFVYLGKQTLIQESEGGNKVSEFNEFFCRDAKKVLLPLQGENWPYAILRACYGDGAPTFAPSWLPQCAQLAPRRLLPTLANRSKP